MSSYDEPIMTLPNGNDSKSGGFGWITNVQTSGFSLGISRDVIRNLIIDVEGFGQRAKQNKKTFYADILYANVKVDNIVFFGSNPNATVFGEEIGTEVKQFNIAGEGEHKIETNNFGFRVGFESRGIGATKIIPWSEQNELSKVFNLGYKTEIGINPGIKGKGFYFLLGLYLAVNGKL